MERDNTQDWLIPAGAAPPLMSELEARVDEALAIAKASERAVVEVGAAAIDAAEQARRAAELAERASVAAMGVADARVAEPPPPEPHPAEPLPVEPDPVAQRPAEPPTAERPLPHRVAPGDDASMRRFSERADRLMRRLRSLERRPVGHGHPSGGAGERRPAA